MLQLAGGDTTDQLRLVPELVVEDAANPVGELGAEEQLPPPPLTGCQSAGTLGGSHPTCEVWA
jgi:hypothetical protein